MQDLGGQEFPRYPDDRNDLIWTAAEDWSYIVEEESECCPGMDECPESGMRTRKRYTSKVPRR